MAPRSSRRNQAPVATRALVVVAASALAVGCYRTAFIGNTALRGAISTDVALQAAKGSGFDKEASSKQKAAGKKSKQKLSLSEALDRQKTKADEQVVRKEEAKLSPEFTFWEGPPSSTEVLFPFLSCFVVIGVIPFISAVNRQFRVKYKVTDRRVSVAGGWDGNDVTEFSYQEIYEMKYGLRFFGYCGDMRINLRDGAKVEMFGLMNFEENYKFILDRVDKECVKRSDPIPSEMDSLN